MASIDVTENLEDQNDINQWGQAILRSKTTLIKPHSKVKESLKNKTNYLINFYLIVHSRRSSSTYT
jgi:hypothetical protein